MQTCGGKPLWRVMVNWWTLQTMIRFNITKRHLKWKTHGVQPCISGLFVFWNPTWNPSSDMDRSKIGPQPGVRGEGCYTKSGSVTRWTSDMKKRNLRSNEPTLWYLRGWLNHPKQPLKWRQQPIARLCEQLSLPWQRMAKWGRNVVEGKFVPLIRRGFNIQCTWLFPAAQRASLAAWTLETHRYFELPKRNTGSNIIGVSNDPTSQCWLEYNLKTIMCFSETLSSSLAPHWRNMDTLSSLHLPKHKLISTGRWARQSWRYPWVKAVLNRTTDASKLTTSSHAITASFVRATSQKSCMFATNWGHLDS